MDKTDPVQDSERPVVEWKSHSPEQDQSKQQCPYPHVPNEVDVHDTCTEYSYLDT